ncbi:hypothetical protein MGYG_06110 [Nannizzia gypsea CBS 118893]|uniref:Initiation-specific alpha-1,6-mannosyltransferase n=1 Tax=Arthroderma gypseum (strain ATCC MYA-4604 / CBS 118893) TaxID=535722 RepID=E4V0H8_ARTGP|nr:hypothetical protein MGYG_06110 [Nannizzia gypsea CBS 118893]EFR03115.1 hypothetical protein MGYG_06110 [Nannizzia gypsea CBS 118893]
MSTAWQRVLRALIVASVISVVLIYSARQFGPASVHTAIHDRPDDQHKAFQPPPPAPDGEPPLISHPPLAVPTPASSSKAAPGPPASSTSVVTPATATTTSSSSPPPPSHPGEANEAIPGVPSKIWQTAKHANLSSEYTDMSNTWIANNPTFRHELLTDESSDDYVRSRYPNSNIVALYTGLKIPILRADLLRYLILLSEGGIWADLDTTCEQPVNSWLPAEMHNANSTVKAGLIVGLEPDADHGGKKVLTNAVLAAQPGSKHIKAVVDDIVKQLYEIAKQKGVGPEGITLEMISDVVEVTGRKKMTAKIIESLSKTLNKEIKEGDLVKNGSKEPQVLDDVIILPVPAFASYDGNPTPPGRVLVTHHHAGTWKSAAEDARKNREKQLQEEADRLKKAADEAERKQKEKAEEQKKEEDASKKAKEDGEKQRKEQETREEAQREASDKQL